MTGNVDIKITVSFTGLVNIKSISSGDTVVINNGANISELLSKLGIKEEHKRFIVTMVNGNKENQYYILKNCDEVKLFLPVGGG